MNDDIKPISAPVSDDSSTGCRLYVREPSWHVAVKLDAARAFCHNMSPGEDFYHRLHQGEIYFFHGSERICMACAERRGLIAREPKRLRESLWSDAAHVAGILAGASDSSEMNDLYV